MDAGGDVFLAGRSDERIKEVKDAIAKKFEIKDFLVIQTETKTLSGYCNPVGTPVEVSSKVSSIKRRRMC